MTHLALDIETFSTEDLRYAGVYRYAESVEVLMLAYSWDGAEPHIVDLAQGEPLPKSISQAIADPDVVKTAWNAQFERVVLGYFFEDCVSEPEQWDCTMVRAQMAGLPASLKLAGRALGIADQKLESGTDLISLFCKPCKATKTNGGRTRNLPHHAPDKWAQFKDYCLQDVRAEQEIRKRLAHAG